MVDQTAEHINIINIIRKRLLMAQRRQKSYADKRWRPLDYEVEDLVFIKISPIIGIRRSMKSKKLSL